MSTFRAVQWLVAGLFAGCTLTAVAQPTTYTYARVQGRPLQLDFYDPTAGTGPAPLVVWIHGGGWSGGTRANAGPLFALLPRGYAVASLDYRLTSQEGEWGTASVTWPAQAHDVKAAVRWLRANAGELGVDPCAFISWGSSAGGHLAAILGTSTNHPYLEGTLGDHRDVSSAVQLAVDYFGPSDLLYLSQDVTDPPGTTNDADAVDSAASLLLGSDQHGYSVADIRENLVNPNQPWPFLRFQAFTAAPARLAEDAASNVQMFIAHGELDTTVAIGQSQRLFDALTRAGTPATLLRVPTAGHGMPGSVAFQVINWLDAQLPLLPGCGCTGDIANQYGTPMPDASVDFGDFLSLLGLIGACPGGTPGCVGDIADDFGTLGSDGQVSFGDFLALLGLIGPCP